MVDAKGKSATEVSLWKRLFSTIALRPLLCIAMMFYWVWINLVFQTPLFFRAIPLSIGIALPSQVAPLLATVLSYLCICLYFKKTRREQKHPAFLWIICSFMSLGSGILVAWMMFTVDSANTALVMMPSSIPQPISVGLFLLGSTLIGFFSALLCIELQRIFGSLGSQHVLFHGSVALLGSMLIITVIAFLPTIIAMILFVLSPLPVAFCLQRTRREFTKKELYCRGEGSKLVIPYKFLVTAFFHGLSLGVLLGWYPIVGVDTTALLICNFISYALAAILLLITAVSIRLNFNHLIYQIAFTLIAAGAFFSIIIDEQLLVGISVQLLGFCYLHLLMWVVCAYFIKVFNVPATWIIGISTCCYMFGQLFGAMSGTLLMQLPNSPLLVSKINASIIAIMLGASILMMSSRNLRTGWGLAKADSELELGAGRSLTAQMIASDSGLSERETAVFVHLAVGKNRKTISEELFVSEETVKSHIQNIYRKLNVHSQQELIRQFDEKHRITLK